MKLFLILISYWWWSREKSLFTVECSENATRCVSAPFFMKHCQTLLLWNCCRWWQQPNPENAQDLPAQAPNDKVPFVCPHYTNPYIINSKGKIKWISWKEIRRMSKFDPSRMDIPNYFVVNIILPQQTWCWASYSPFRNDITSLAAFFHKMLWGCWKLGRLVSPLQGATSWLLHNTNSERQWACPYSGTTQPITSLMGSERTFISMSWFDTAIIPNIGLMIKQLLLWSYWLGIIYGNKMVTNLPIHFRNIVHVY